MKKLISVLCTVLIVLSTVIPPVHAEPYDTESVQSAVTLSEETEHNHIALAESAQTPALLSEHTHTGTLAWESDEQVHSKYWTCCHEFELFFVAHNWVNGKCTDCGYVCGHMDSPGDCSICGYRCNHSGGTATCTQKAVCDKCGEAYGELNSTNHTGTYDWQSEEQVHSKYWTCCHEFELFFVAHNWVNGKCTDCGYVCGHMDSPGDCSICGYRCNHSGGTATCTQKAVCDKCGEAYGELNSTNHTGTYDWQSEEQVHSKYWTCCHEFELFFVAHNWVNGKCTDCGYVCGHMDSPGDCSICGYRCNHSGGTATCTQKAVCDKCGEAYGELNSTNLTGTLAWESEEQVHSKYWTCCHEFELFFVAHNWVNGKCTECGYVCGHSGGTATCTQKAVCDKCGEAYGELDDSNHSGTFAWDTNETEHEKTWNCCRCTSIGVHTWEDGKCTECGYVCGHSGGTATCTQKAVCDKCGEAYGELNSTNHSGTQSWKTKETTHQEIWGCCGKAIQSAPVPHTWENSECTVCRYVCEHSFKWIENQCLKACVFCSKTVPAHDGQLVWSQSISHHSQYWSCCMEPASPLKRHHWENGKCTECGYVCGHAGGTATCTQQAVCNICSEAYGNVKPSNHSGTESWKITETTHQRIWGCCGKAILLIPIPHTWENGECTECGYVCGHTGGTATCTQKAVCDKCGEAYGELDDSNHSGTESWEITETTHQKIWGCCGKAILPNPIPHTWENGECTECGYVCGHAGGTATCTQKAVCDKCGEAYGELDDSNHSGTESWEITETTHQKIWGCCGKAILPNPIPHTWENGECTECGYVCGHTGGTATCTQKAVCTYCHNEYGELDPANHPLEYIPAVDATVTATGNDEYWHCLDCGKYFADENGDEELSLDDTIIDKLPPEIIEGMNQTVTEGEQKALTFRSNAAFADFIRVEVDGYELVRDREYTVEEGSIIATLKPGFVATLSVGEHTLGIVSESGTAIAVFTVTDDHASTDNSKDDSKDDSTDKSTNHAENSPQTGDNSNVVFWILISVISLAALCTTATVSKKKKRSR